MRPSGRWVAKLDQPNGAQQSSADGQWTALRHRRSLLANNSDVQSLRGWRIVDPTTPSIPKIIQRLTKSNFMGGGLNLSERLLLEDVVFRVPFPRASYQACVFLWSCLSDIPHVLTMRTEESRLVELLRASWSRPSSNGWRTGRHGVSKCGHRRSPGGLHDVRGGRPGRRMDLGWIFRRDGRCTEDLQGHPRSSARRQCAAVR